MFVVSNIYGGDTFSNVRDKKMGVKRLAFLLFVYIIYVLNSV